jgi:hypothetical protein
LEQGHLEESEKVFRKDLTYHPNNPWALVGLINSLKKQLESCCGGSDELAQLQEQLQKQRQTEYADYNVKAACACCQAND